MNYNVATRQVNIWLKNNKYQTKALQYNESKPIMACSALWLMLTRYLVIKIRPILKSWGWL